MHVRPGVSLSVLGLEVTVDRIECITAKTSEIPANTSNAKDNQYSEPNEEVPRIVPDHTKLFIIQCAFGVGLVSLFNRPHAHPDFPKLFLSRKLRKNRRWFPIDHTTHFREFFRCKKLSVKLSVKLSENGDKKLRKIVSGILGKPLKPQ